MMRKLVVLVSILRWREELHLCNVENYSYLKITSNDRKFICRELCWVRADRLFLSAINLRPLG